MQLSSATLLLLLYFSKEIVSRCPCLSKNINSSLSLCLSVCCCLSEFTLLHSSRQRIHSTKRIIFNQLLFTRMKRSGEDAQGEQRQGCSRSFVFQRFSVISNEFTTKSRGSSDERRRRQGFNGKKKRQIVVIEKKNSEEERIGTPEEGILFIC